MPFAFENRETTVRSEANQVRSAALLLIATLIWPFVAEQPEEFVANLQAA